MREALEYAIDKKALTDAVGRGFWHPIYEIVHSIPPKAGTVPRKYNPEKAIELIKEAGFSQGLKVKMSSESDPDYNRAIVAIQRYLKEVGIEVQTEPLARAMYTQVMYEPVIGNNLFLSGQRGGPNELLISEIGWR